MPSRDYDPHRDDGRPPERWSGEPSRDASRREAERRSARGSAFDDPDAGEHAPSGRGGTFTPPEAGRGGSAFGSAREVRSAGPAGPGSSCGGSGGRASGSQAYGQRSADEMDRDRERDLERGRALDAPEAWDDRDGPPPERSERSSPSRTGSAWSAPAERRSAWTDATRGRGRAPESEHRTNWQRGLDREDDTQFDPDYRQWREEQMRLLDRDYAQWRKERYRKFAEEFSQWRSQRVRSHVQTSTQRPGSSEGQLPQLSDITPLGTPTDTPPHEERERPSEPERERSHGLLGSLLGGHGDRHKA